MGQGVRSEREQSGVKRTKAYFILCFRVPTNSVGAKGEGQRGAKMSKRGEGEQRGVKGSEEYSILGFRVLTTSVG